MILVFACTGCTNYAKKYSKNTVVVKGNGSIVEVAVENYKGTKVKAEDLTAYIDEQIDSYNEENGSGVKKKKLLVEDMSKVKLVIKYNGIDDYNNFNALECTLDDYSNVDKDLLTGTFYDEAGKEVKVKKFENTDKAKVLIISEPTDIVINKKILYYNDQIKYKNGVMTASGKKNAVVIYK